MGMIMFLSLGPSPRESSCYIQWELYITIHNHIVSGARHLVHIQDGWLHKRCNVFITLVRYNIFSDDYVSYQIHDQQYMLKN